MRRCAALRTSCLSPAGFSCQPRRWRSYDKADLTKEALQRQVEAGLGEDGEGKPLKIDPDARTVGTAAGSLPISPLFDPAWMKARRRERKPDKGPPLGRFRSKLARNPFARALATPVRRCPITKTAQPRFFLQDYELVKHPTEQKDWWAPGPLSFDLIDPDAGRKQQPPPSDDAVDEGGTASAGDTVGATTATDAAPSDTSDASATATHTQAVDNADGEDGPAGPRRRRRAPVTIYSLCNNTLLDRLNERPQRIAAAILALRQGMAIGPAAERATWHSGMGTTLLHLYRRKAADALIGWANRAGEPEHHFIRPCASWAAVKDVHLRGCVLWLPGDEASAAAGANYATLDVQEVRYGAKMAVHNLHWLLGEAEVGRLREAAEVFRDNEILVLKQRKDIRVMRLHMLLWRLQGYLAGSE